MKKTFFRIHFSFLLLLVLGYFTKTLIGILMMYACLCVHEGGHLLAASFFKVPVDYIMVMPFGIAIRLNRRKLSGILSHIIILLFGPLANLLLVLLLYNCSEYIGQDIYAFLFRANLTLAIFNLLPVISLDGGRVSYLLLCEIFGSIIGYNLSIRISKICVIILSILGVWVLFVTRMNLSLILITSFLGYTLWTDSGYEKLLMIQKMLDYKEKKSKTGVYPVTAVAISEDVPLRRVLRNFKNRSICVVNVLDRDFKIKQTLTEKQVIDAMLKNGAGVCQRQMK